MSREKIKEIITKAQLMSKRYAVQLIDEIEQMLKDDYNFEFPKAFDYTKCSKNRRGDEVLFVEKNIDRSLFYAYKDSGFCHSVRVGKDGRWGGFESPGLDLIMDE